MANRDATMKFHPDVLAGKEISPEMSRDAFNIWFRLSPNQARDWLNRKLEDAQREDAKWLGYTE